MNEQLSGPMVREEWSRPDVRRSSGRLGAKLFMAAGGLTIINNNVPPTEHLNLPVLYGIGAFGIVFGIGCFLAPWERWPRWATLALGPIALALVSVANLFGGVSAYSYAVYFVVVFVYIGMTQPPYTSVALALPAAAAYVAPALLTPDAPAIAALSASVAIPVCVLVGEVISRATARSRVARTLAERRADVLRALAHSSRKMNALDVDLVLGRVVSAARGLGFDAAEICLYDEPSQTHTSSHSKGLPDEYASSSYPIESGIAGRVREERTTVTVDDYSSSDHALPSLRASGFRAVVASPIFSGGRFVAALIAGTHERRGIDPQDEEAIELLAAQAGHALENAKRFETERRTVERLAELDRLKNRFVSNVSHELRTPLTVIEGMGQTLAEKWRDLDDDARDDLIERLNRNAIALDGIIARLLDFSNVEEGRLEARLGPVDLVGLCESVAGRLRSLFAERELVVSLPERATVPVDDSLIERVLENLLANAVHHTPRGTRVELSVEIEGGSVVVSVTDNGPGIPEGELSLVGDRFFRGQDATRRATRGAGIGLAFSRELLRLHSSALEISSRPGEGARFSFALPLLSTRGLRRGTAEPPVNGSGGPGAGPGRPVGNQGAPDRLGA